jgi:hypothetical protein
MASNDYHFITHWRVEGTKPIFSANHRWAMRKGEENLRLELAGRHAKRA